MSSGSQKGKEKESEEINYSKMGVYKEKRVSLPTD
jgi:hypothetical protein